MHQSPRLTSGARRDDGGPAVTLPTASVAVVTYERPTYVERCLRQLLAQTCPPKEIIVVDSSTGRDTERLVREQFPSVAYAICPAGRGATGTARNISYRLATGEVLAFVDDDAFAEPDWLATLLPLFDDPSVGAVGGRQIRQQPGELTQGVDAIGQLLADGTLTGHFAADPGQVVEVDHLLGANMAFRHSVLDQLGGIHDGYAGTCIREETDLCLRVRGAGYRLLYTPDAVVEHVAGPYAKGQRFDLRYSYWTQKNHLILLIRNFGITDPLVRRFLVSSWRTALADGGVRLERAREPGPTSRAGRGVEGGRSRRPRTAVTAAASVSGVVDGIRLTGRRPEALSRRNGRHRAAWAEALASQVNWRARRRPRATMAPMIWRPPASAASRPSASPSASGSTSRAASPHTSGSELRRAATTGTPTAMPSRAGSPKPS